MKAIEVSLVIYGDENEDGKLIVYRLSVAIGPGRDDVNVEQVVEELREMLSKWAITWLRLGQAVRLEEL